MSTKVKLKFEQVVSIGILVKEKCHLHEGFAIYDAGWSDQTIANRFQVSPAQVASLRRKLIGEMKRSVAVREDRLAALEERVQVLEDLMMK